MIAGQSYGATGPVAMRNPGLLLDVQLAKGATFTQPVSLLAANMHEKQLKAFDAPLVSRT